jgi:hypothetical protein
LPAPAPPAPHPPPPPAGTVYPRADRPYDQWARNQRPQGTVYGGRPVGFGGPAPGPPEVSGSLTGHILSQGRHDTSAPRSSTGRVVVILTVALSTIVILGLIVAIFFRDALTELIKSLFSA